MRKIVLLVLASALICVNVVRADDLVRQKRAWLPPIFGIQAEEETREADEIGDPEVVEPEGIAPEVAAQPDVVYYPVWSVHKYNGVQLAPTQYHVAHHTVAQQTTNDSPARVVVADHRQPAIQTVQNNEVVASNVQTAQPAPVPQTNQLAASAASNVMPADLIQFAREFGITDFSQLPSLDEVGNLLGSTTPEETIETIREIAATEDGRSLIRSFIEGQGRNADNEVAASENEESVANPEDQQNVDLDESETLFVPQYADAIGNQNNFLVPNVYAQNPIQSDATSYDDAESDETEATTPNPGAISRIMQWVNFLNPLALRSEIPIPPTPTVPRPTNTLKTVSTVTTGEHNQHTVPIPSLPEPAPLPQIAGFSQSTPQLPPIHIPYRNIPAVFAPNSVKASGQYVRVKLPAGGYNPAHLPIDPVYLNAIQNQLQSARVLPTPQATQGTFQPINSNVARNIDQTFAQNTISFRQNPIQVADSSVASNVQPLQVTSQAAKDQSNRALPVGQLATAFVDPRLAVNSPIAQQSTQNVPLIHNSKQLFVPNTSNGQQYLQLPTLYAPSTFQQQFLQLPTLATPNTFQSPSQHIGQLPLSLANFEAFKNAPQIVTSYDAPILPQFHSLNNSTVAFKASPQSSKVYINQEYDLRPAGSEAIESKANETIVTNTTTVVTTPTASNNQTLVDKNVDATTTETVVEVSTESKLVAAKSTTENDIIRTTTGDDDINKSTTPKPTKRASRRRLPSKDAESTESAIKYQRHMPSDWKANRMYRANVKAIDLMPITVRHMLDTEHATKTEDDTKKAI